MRNQFKGGGGAPYINNVEHTTMGYIQPTVDSNDIDIHW